MIMGVPTSRIAPRRNSLVTPADNLPDLLQREATAPRRFDPRCGAPYVSILVGKINAAPKCSLIGAYFFRCTR